MNSRKTIKIIKGFCSRQIFEDKQTRVLQCINTGAYKDALALTDELIGNMRGWKDEQRELSALSNKGYLLKMAGEFELAEETYREVLKRTADCKTVDCMVVKQNLITLLCEMKRFDEAKELYEEIENEMTEGKIQVPDNVLVFMYNTGSSCLVSRNLQK